MGGASGAAAIVIGSAIIFGQGGGGNPSFANFWVDTTANPNNCARQPDAGAYVDADACSSFNAAYQAASCGDTINVKEIGGGSRYSDQTISERTGDTACGMNVVIQETPGENVLTNSITLGSGCSYNSVGANHLTLKGFNFDVPTGGGAGLCMWGQSDNIVFDGNDGGALLLQSVSNVTLINNDWGPCNSPNHPDPPNCWRLDILDGRNDGEPPLSNILFENNTVHDFECNPLNCGGGGDHSECIFFTGGSNITFRRNIFWDCELYAIAMGENPSSEMDGVLIENNWFGRTCNRCDTLSGVGAHPAIESGGTKRIDNVLIRYNSSGNDIPLYFKEGNNTFLNWRIIGNISGTNSCNSGESGLTYDYNLFKGGTCGSNSTNISTMPYVDATANEWPFDYHLTGAETGSADNYVILTSADYALLLDYDEQSRPQDSTTRDAGSDER
jgi:hypothetical protein